MAVQLGFAPKCEAIEVEAYKPSVSNLRLAHNQVCPNLEKFIPDTDGNVRPPLPPVSPMIRHYPTVKRQHRLVMHFPVLGSFWVVLFSSQQVATAGACHNVFLEQPLDTSRCWLNKRSTSTICVVAAVPGFRRSGKRMSYIIHSATIAHVPPERS